MICTDLSAKSLRQLLNLLLLILLALGEVFDGLLILLPLFLVPFIAFLILFLLQFFLLQGQAVFEGQVDSDESQVVEKFVRLLVSNEIIEFRIDDSP